MEVRDEVIGSVGEAGGFTEAGLKKQITVDMSSPVVGGKIKTYFISHLHSLNIFF